MTREEVIRGLEETYQRYIVTEGQGILVDSDGYEYALIDPMLVKDTLALLREQEPVEPILQSGGNYVCGNCGMYTVGYIHPLTGESVQTWKYCGKCGKKVRWDG